MQELGDALRLVSLVVELGPSNQARWMVRHLGRGAWLAGRSLGPVDPEHPSTPPAVERAPDLTILTSIEGELADVERALARLDDGTYGTCQVCGEPIDEARFAAEPATARCAEHAAG